MTSEELDALKRLAEAAKKCGLSLHAAAEMFRNRPIEPWWRTGSKAPAFVVDSNPSEWWQRGDEPPTFGLAA